MTIAEFRDACEHLSRFASIREKAPEPTDRVFVRVADGVVTLVAGDTDKTLVANLPAGASGSGKALVSSRMLLSAGKMLRGKGEVAFEFASGGVVMKTSTGGKMVIPSVADELPAWVRPSESKPIATASAPAGFWPALVKYISAENTLLLASGGAVVTRVEDEELVLTWAHRYVYVQATLPLLDEPLLCGEAGALPLDFVASLRGLDGPTELVIHAGPTHVKSASYLAVVEPTFVKLGAYDVSLPTPTTKVTTDRKQLIESIKALPNPDEHQRVTLTTLGSRLGIATHSAGSVEVPAKVTGKAGSITFVAPRLSKLLGAVSGTEVTFGFDADNTAPVEFKEEHGWRVYLAPVAR